MVELTAQHLREIVEEVISESIGMHRLSRVESEGDYYSPPAGPPTDEEIDDFLCSNPLLDFDLVEQLIDPGFTGFWTKKAHASQDWLTEFRSHVEQWATTTAWLAGDLPWIAADRQSETQIWTPATEVRPGWVQTSPTCLLLAAELLHQGKLLSEMHWRDFEKLIAVLLENDGWEVQLTKASRDGGIDVVATRSDPTVGEIRSVWQAKKLGLTSKVTLRDVRELSAVREAESATKGLIVTTSHLTRNAIEWVRRDIYRLGYKDKEGVECWVRAVLLGKTPP
jgi:restriction system protein